MRYIVTWMDGNTPKVEDLQLERKPTELITRDGFDAYIVKEIGHDAVRTLLRVLTCVDIPDNVEPREPRVSGW